MSLCFSVCLSTSFRHISILIQLHLYVAHTRRTKGLNLENFEQNSNVPSEIGERGIGKYFRFGWLKRLEIQESSHGGDGCGGGGGM